MQACMDCATLPAMNTWSEYVRSLAGTEPQESVGEKVGVSGSTISRWRNGKSKPVPAEAASFAVKYGGNVLEAFVAAGFLTDEEAGIQPPVRATLDDVPTVDLAREVARRLGDEGEAGGDGGSVTPIKPRGPRVPSAPRRTVRDTSKLVAKRSSEAAGAPIED